VSSVPSARSSPSPGRQRGARSWRVYDACRACADVGIIVKADPGQLGSGDEADEQLAYRFRVQKPAPGVAEDPVVRAMGKPVLRQAFPPSAQDGDGHPVEVDAASAGLGLGTELGRAPGDALERAADRHALSIEVEVRSTAARRSRRVASPCARRDATPDTAAGPMRGPGRPPAR